MELPRATGVAPRRGRGPDRRLRTRDSMFASRLNGLSLVALERLVGEVGVGVDLLHVVQLFQLVE